MEPLHQARVAPHDGFAPMRREEAASILTAAAGRTLAVQGDPARVEAVLRSVKSLIGQIVFASQETDQLSRKDARQIFDAYQKLARLMAEVPALCTAAPPNLPSHWRDSMEKWATHACAPAQAGAPVDWLAQFAYPKILGLYVAAFGKEPGVTMDGPAVRLVSAVFDHALRLAKQNPSGIPDVDKRSGEALRARAGATWLKAVASTTPDPLWAEDMILRHAENLERYLPWLPGEEIS
ncbi:hypothetical protein BKE38_22410 [Pseudoroseomonas deserti]|uniref:Uncharacterized protein n=1 Tax=Teichococcus deserti TaxID=1817963 RepID=A0A1V2GYT0_9PROT|nr:hypothetical protein [Pseudoroseomonas deserti]ONG47974.1 hypothetical protein BKE38_22410 [Pseudoroseomonas deserti]